jgi:hypothetical protein
VNPNPNTEASFAETIVDLLRQRSAYRPHDRAFTFLVDGEQLRAFGPAHPVATELGKRLLLESYAEPFEQAIGGF